LATPWVRDAIRTPEKQVRERRMSEILADVATTLADLVPEQARQMPKLIESIEREQMRTMILEEVIRADGRRTDEIRPSASASAFFPHGSSLFTRGKQACGHTSTAPTSRSDELEEEFRVHAALQLPVQRRRKSMRPGRRGSP
jgi:polyribonucleotide nucleotidyltransferase